MNKTVNSKGAMPCRLVIALIAMCLTAVVNAQTTDEVQMTIEEVIVTAERREANLQDVPISVTSFSATDLENFQVRVLGDLQSLVPNLSVHVGDANNAVVYIRGVGQIDSIAFFEPGVGIYLDDVYLGRAQGAFLDVLDVERIEVLRGPQGTLYGRNTVGGAVKYVSAAPTNDFSTDVSAIFGNYSRTDVKASISGPIVEDRLLGRLTVAYLSRDGYSENLFDGRDDGDKDTFYTRAVLQFNASDNFSVQLAADYTDSDPDRSRTPAKETPISILIVDPFTFGLSVDTFPADTDPFLVNADFNTVEQTKTKGVDLKLTWDISDALTFKSISSYRDLVLLQHDNCEFRGTQMFQDKAQTAKNGPVLLKGCNTVLGHLGTSLRASWEAVVRGVTPLGKDQPLPARRALRPTTSQLAESVIIMLKEY